MSEEETPKDAFDKPMVWVDSYNVHLPKSDNIPVSSTVNGVSGITHDGEIYCVGCALEMGLVEQKDGEIYANVEGELVRPRKAPSTGIVLPSYESQIQMHCSRDEHCVNSVSGEDHPYTHDCDIGIGIDARTIEH